MIAPSRKNPFPDEGSMFTPMMRAAVELFTRSDETWIVLSEHTG